MYRRINFLACVLVAISISTIQAQDFFGWAHSIGNSHENEVSDMVVDNDGNVYITGILEGTIDFDPSVNTSNLTPTGAQGAFLAKYDQHGDLVWNRKIEVNSITDIFFNGGSIVAYGTFIGTATIDTQTYTNTLSTTALASFIAGFSLSDGSLLGGRAISSSGDQETFDVKGKDDFVYISGSFQGTIDLGTALSSAESTQRGNAKDFYIARINNMGGIDWAKTVATNGAANRIDEIELDDDGGLYMGGILRENLDFNSGTNLAAAFDNLNQGFVTKLDTAGTFRWFRRTRRTNQPGSGLARAAINSLEIDKAGNVTAVGHLIVDASVDGFSNFLTTGNGTLDLLFIKYSPTGEGLELRNIGAPGAIAGVSHVIDGNGNYIILGTGQNTNNDLDPGAGVQSVAFGTAERDIFVAKYDSLFDFQWADGFTGNTVIDRAAGLIEKDGLIYIGGYHQGGIDVEFGSGNTVLASQGGRDMLLARLNNVAVFNQEINLCDGERLEVGNNVYDQAGTYQDIFPAQTVNDQDSVVNTTILGVLAPISLSVDLTQVTCNGESDGAATVTASDVATRNYQYSIDGNNFQASPTFSGLAAGAYTIEVIDGDNCEAMISFEIQEPEAFAGAPVVVDNVCSGGTDGQITVNVTGGTGTLTYSIDGTNFQASNVFSNLASGDYTVTAKDASDCTVSGTVSVSEPAPVALVENSVQPASCFGASDGSLEVQASGGTGPYAYSIDGTNFQVSGIFSGLAAGAYTLTARDANSCVGALSVTVNEPDALSVSLSLTEVTCRRDNNGAIQVTNVAGGTAPYEYSVDGTNFTTTDVFTQLTAGNYTLTVRDANGCTITENIMLREPDLLTGIIAGTTDIRCNGAATGAIGVGAFGGWGDFTYALDGTNFQSSNIFTGLVAGTYTVTIKDRLGCTTQLTTTLTEPTALNLGFEKADISCFGQGDGQITGFATGGTVPYTYSLDGTTFQAGAFTNLEPGSYTLSVKDANECVVTANVTLTEPDALVPDDPSVTDVTCHGGANGSITLNQTTGIGPFRYSIEDSDFQSSGTFNGLAAGAYSLTIRDANNCTVGLTVNVGEPEILSLSSVITDALCQGGTNGSVTLTAGGGTGPYRYSIDGTTFQQSNDFTGLAPGTYNFTVTDANDCSVSLSASVGEPAVLSLSATSTNALCQGDTNGSVTLTAGGGTAPYRYSVDGTTFQNSNTFTGLAAGNYTLTLIDANECTTTTDVSIAEPAALTATASLVNDNTINTTAMGGTAPYEYALDGTTFQRSGTFSNLSNGDYMVTVRDANGCTTTASGSLIVTSIDLPDQLPELKSYPNPVTDVLIISEVTAGDDIRLIDLNGQLMGQVAIKTSQKDYSLSVAHIRAGIFLLSVKDRNGRVRLMKKVIRKY